MHDEEFILLFTAIINKNIKIDGFIKEQIYSSINDNGMFVGLCILYILKTNFFNYLVTHD